MRILEIIWAGGPPAIELIVALLNAARAQFAVEFDGASGVVTGAGQPLPPSSGIANGAPAIVAKSAP